MVNIRVVRDRRSVRSDVRSLLALADDEFVPPLTGSERADVARGEEEEWGPDLDSYVAGCLERPMLGAFDGDDLVGFASIDPVTDVAALEGFLPSNHVDIVVVDPDYRGRGIATRFYERLLSDLPTDLARPHVSTKTWSTNRAHLSVLERLGFECVERIPDDRGDGVDTVYYAREAER